MKIASFNINNVRKRLPNLLAWLRQTMPDVVCLQELKTTDTEPRSGVRATRQCGKARRAGTELPSSAAGRLAHSTA